MIKTEYKKISTKGNTDIIDLTGLVVDSLNDSGLVTGMVTVFTPSSTSGITTIEYESGCIADLQRMFDQVAPANINYAHNARWGDGNGHSHVRAALLGASLSVPFENRRLLLGTWQQIILVDFDTRPRQREVVVQILGE